MHAIDAYSKVFVSLMFSVCSERVEHKFLSVPGCYIESRNSVDHLGTELKNRSKNVKKQSMPPSTATSSAMMSPVEDDVS